MTVDGTDFLIPEPSPFNPSYFSHKFGHAGLRYEVAICIQTGDIVWTNGPFPCGSWNDKKIFNNGLKHHLLHGERVEADAGYSGDICCSPPNDFGGNREWRAMKGQALARHENTNGIFKRFNVLKHTFRGDIETHGLFFKAVVAIVQHDIKNGRLSYSVHYHIEHTH